MSDPVLEVPVLITGGSLVGLSTALFLGHYGVRSLAVEHHRGMAIYPRAAQLYQRTMELLRTVGIEQIAMEKSEEQFVQDGAVMAVETLAGKELAWYVPDGPDVPAVTARTAVCEPDAGATAEPRRPAAAGAAGRSTSALTVMSR